jgi:hypothetical protein
LTPVQRQERVSEATVKPRDGARTLGRATNKAVWAEDEAGPALPRHAHCLLRTFVAPSARPAV